MDFWVKGVHEMFLLPNVIVNYEKRSNQSECENQRNLFGFGSVAGSVSYWALEFVRLRANLLGSTWRY